MVYRDNFVDLTTHNNVFSQKKKKKKTTTTTTHNNTVGLRFAAQDKDVWDLGLVSPVQ